MINTNYLQNILKYHNVFEAMTDAVVLVNIELDGSLSKILDVNKAAIELLGFNKEEILNKYLFDFEVAQTKDEQIKKMEEKKETILKNKQASFEMTLEHKEGYEIFVNVKALFIEDEKQPYLINIIEDITKSKEIEKNLKESEERFKVMFENNPIATFYEDFSLIYSYFDKLKEKGIVDLRGFLDENNSELINLARMVKIINVNKEAIKLHNAKNKNELLLSLDNTFTKLSFKAFKDELIGIWNGNEEGEFEAIVKTLDSKKLNVIINYKKLPLINNNNYHYLVTIKDITENKKFEEAKFRNHSLNALGEMASSVAHDFNNSLQSILGNLELAMYDHNISIKTLDLLNTIKVATIDAANRVKIVRRFGRNNEENEYKLINIEDVIDDVIIQSRPIWKDDTNKKGISIEIIKKYGKVPKVLGNSSELRHVIYNILKNSIESIVKNGIIRFLTVVSDKGVEVHITDNGIGMNEKEKSKIFQPFYTTKGFELGRGLGMSGVYTITKEHKADISIISALRKGTTIKIVFPFSNIKEDTKTEIKSREDKKIFKKLNILWVDDEDMIRDIAEKYIDLIGHEGSTAKDGLEALDLLKKNNYDLLITDIGMPNMNGWQLIENIKELNNDLKIIVVTGWGANITVMEKEKYGIYETLEKPIQFKDLKKIIDTI